MTKTKICGIALVTNRHHLRSGDTDHDLYGKRNATLHGYLFLELHDRLCSDGNLGCAGLTPGEAELNEFRKNLHTVVFAFRSTLEHHWHRNGFHG
jgi:hypothetical protein